jgi:hypothetical protein
MTYPAEFKRLVLTLLAKTAPYVFSNVSSPPDSGEDHCNTWCDGKDSTPVKIPGFTGANSVRMPTMHLTITTSDIRPLLLRHGFLPREISEDLVSDDLIRYVDPEEQYCGCLRGDYQRWVEPKNRHAEPVREP